MLIAKNSALSDFLNELSLGKGLERRVEGQRWKRGITKRSHPIPMSPLLTFLFAIFFEQHLNLISASDPDPLQDFCILESGSGSCKNSSVATVEDFVFSGIKSPGNDIGSGFSSTPVNVNVFPGLNTLGMSLVRADFSAGGVNVPHYHPRATEVAFVVEGSIYSGFVDTQGRVFAKVIEKGEVMVFPKGMVHFQMNVGKSPATILGSFNSQNPGLVRIPTTMFGSEIKDEILETSFGLSAKELAKLRSKFHSSR